MRNLPLRIAATLLLVVALLLSNLIAVLLLPWAAFNGLRARRQPERPTPSTPNSPVVANDTTFDDLLAQHPRVLVDFWAPWCGPCLLMKPALEEIAKRRSGDLVVLAVNTTTNTGLASRYEIRGLPTLIVFQNGAEIRRHAGALGIQELDALLGSD